MRLHDHLTWVTWVWPDRTDLTGRTLRNGWLYTEGASYLDGDGSLFGTDAIVYPAEAENASCRRASVAAAAVAGKDDQRPGWLIHALTAPTASERPAPAGIMSSARGAGPTAHTCVAPGSAAC